MKFLLLLVFTLFAGCSKIPSPKERLATLISLEDTHTIQKKIETEKFTFFTLQNVTQSCKNINIYIEGDGLAWVTRSRISKNPTPINPEAFKLMNVDKSRCKIYIARPCQYIKSKNCQKKYWTSNRFDKDVIQSFTKVLDKIKKAYKNNSFTLVGYSGGGAVATLIPIYRDDIKSIVTIAGNLDHEKWTSIHRITPLNASLNPVDYTNKLENIKQYHLIGKNDKIMPKEVFNSYYKAFKNKKNISFKLYDASHNENWEKNYKDFLQGLDHEPRK